jgi:hypothetical protein
VIVSPLDSVDACPVSAACAVCGGRERLRATTYDGEIGVYCRTLCADCVVGGQRPQLTPGQEKLAILAHCDHLGISTDEMVLAHHAEAEHDEFLQNPLALKYVDRSLDEVLAADASIRVEIVALTPPPGPDQLRARYGGNARERAPGWWRTLVFGTLRERKRRRERTPEQWRQLYEEGACEPDPNKGA